MSPLELAPLLVVSALAAAALMLARRHPVLWRMAGRNALRRRSQALVVVAGLMVGTAILTGSLAAGDSLAFGIRKGAYDSLGPADVFVQVEGSLHFPRVLHDDLAANRSVQESVHAMAPLLYEEAAFTDQESRQSEPRASLIGFDPQLNRPFGTFRTPDGRSVDGSDLGAREIYLTQELATKLEAQPGDELVMNYAKPAPPRVPRLFVFNGSLTASAGACPVPALCEYVATPDQPAQFAIPVEEGAVAMTTAVAWSGPSASAVDLDQVVRAPEGSSYANANGTPAQPDNPSVLNITTGAGQKLTSGDWIWQVGGKVAANQPFRAVALVFYEEYNLTALQEFAREAEAHGFSPDDFAPPGMLDGQPGETARVRVKEVVTRDGFGDFLLGQNAFAHYDTVADLYGQEGRVNLIAVSADADPTRGAARTQDVTRVLEEAIAASAAARPDEPALQSVSVSPVKSRFLDAADRAGTLFKEFLTTIGSFTIIAGIMLIVNIFVMLAEERKSELGMARAVGLRRRQLILLFAFEGLLYAAVATVAGVLLGIALAYGLILGFNEIFAASGRDTGILTIPFHVETPSILWGFAAGLLITMATVAVASWRVSRLNIVRAIRRMEDPPRRASKAAFLTGIALLGVGLAMTLDGFLRDVFVEKAIAPTIALFGAGLVASRYVPAKHAYPFAGAAIAGYAAWGIFRLGNPDGAINRMMGPVRGVLIVLAVVLILLHAPQLVRAVTALLLRFKRLVPAVRPGVAYPLEKKTRTGLTVTMFALVVLVVVAFSIFGATFALDLETQSGGYHVEGDATVPVGNLRAWHAQNADPEAPDPFPRIARYDELRYAIAFGGRMIEIEGERPEYQGPPIDYVYAYEEAFARNNRYGFESLDPAYATAEEAYLAVLRDPTLVIVSQQYNFDQQGQPGRFAAGDTLTMETANGRAEFRIVGFQKQLYLGGVFVHPQVLEANFQRIRGDYLFQLHEGEDPEVAAREIESAFQGAGMNAVSIAEEAERQMEQSKRFITLFQLFLGFGLVVGIASLGIVTARSVLERRQEIGMLRAVGYSRKDILRMFLIEVYLTTTLGVIIGGAIGIILSYGVVVSTPALESLGVQYRIPWGDLGLILLLVYAAVFLATYWPARRGSMTPPAEAVRYVE